MNDDDARLEVLGAVYRERFHSFLRVSEAICGDVDAARDAVQDGFASAIRARAGFRGEGAVERWVWRCVVNAARSARRAQRFETPIDDTLVLGESTNGDSAGELRALLAGLPERQKLVLFLRHYADLDYRSIAVALDIEIGTVGATLSQAHAALRRLMKEVPQ